MNLNRKTGKFYAIQYCVCKNAYYLCDFDEETNKATWTSKLESAQLFQTEIGINDFVARYVNDRKCIVVNVKVE